MTHAKITAKLGKRGWVGFVAVFDGRRRMWGKSTQIVRLSSSDAKADAQRMADEILATAKIGGLQVK